VACPRRLGEAAAQGVEVAFGVDVDQDAGIVEVDGEGGIAGDDAARAFVAAQLGELGVELGGESDRMTTPPAVLRVGDGVVIERPRHGDQRRRPDQRHVAGENEPAGRIGRGLHAGGDRRSHAERPAAVAADVGKDDDVARRDAAAGDVDERSRRHDHGAQVAGDRACQRLRQHARCAQRLRQLVAAGAEALASPGSQHDEGSL
jgi:hypothetical protein